MFDLYDLLLKGNAKSDIRLLSGDVVFIPLIKKTARAEGYFRRPHLFELTDEDNVKDLIFFAASYFLLRPNTSLGRSRSLLFDPLP